MQTAAATFMPSSMARLVGRGRACPRRRASRLSSSLFGSRSPVQILGEAIRAERDALGDGAQVDGVADRARARGSWPWRRCANARPWRWPRASASGRRLLRANAEQEHPPGREPAQRREIERLIGLARELARFGVLEQAPPRARSSSATTFCLSRPPSVTRTASTSSGSAGGVTRGGVDLQSHRASAPGTSGGWLAERAWAGGARYCHPGAAPSSLARVFRASSLAVSALSPCRSR